MSSLRPDANNPPYLVCLGCALVPFIAVQLTYLLAADQGSVPWCNPYWDSCTSISATGRHPPASFVFRGLMLPSAALMMIFWYLHWLWLRHPALHTDATAGTGARHRALNSMLALGVIACIGLILYVTVLGEVGDSWRLQRKIGTILFFSFTFLAQLLLATRLLQLDEQLHPKAAILGRRILRLCQLLLCIGMLSVLLQLLNAPWHDRVEDAVEWGLALLLQLNFLLCASYWRRSPWRMEFRQDAK